MIHAKELITYFHCSSFLDKGRLDFILQVVDLLWEVKLWGTRLNGEFLAEGDPFPCKISRLYKGLEGKHGCTIIRYIARDFINRIINCEDWEDCVCCYQRRLLQRIHCTHKEIHSSKLRRLPLTLISRVSSDHKILSKSCYVLGEEEEECKMKEKRPSRQAVSEGLSVDRTPFGELIEHPREGKPYLTDDRSQP